MGTVRLKYSRSLLVCLLTTGRPVTVESTVFLLSNSPNSLQRPEPALGVRLESESNFEEEI